MRDDGRVSRKQIDLSDCNGASEAIGLADGAPSSGSVFLGRNERYADLNTWILIHVELEVRREGALVGPEQ